MYLELQQESILLGRRPSGFTEHYYTEWDDGLGKEKIALFLLASVDSTQVPGAEIGKEAFQLLQDHFLDDLDGDPYDRFESALREVNLMINEKEKDLDLKFIPNMHVLIGVVQKDMLFLSQRGNAQGYLIRKRHVSSITDGLFDAHNKDDLFQNIASGSLEVGDSLVFVTGPLVQYITPNDLSKIFSEHPLNRAFKEIAELLNNDLDEQMAVLGFEVLEKSTSQIQHDSNEEEFYEEAEPVEIKIPSRVSSDQIKNSLNVLQNWVAKKGSNSYFQKLKTFNKKQLVALLASVFGIFIVSVFALDFGLNRGKQIQDLEFKLETAQANISQASTRGSFDKDEANALLADAETLAIEILNSGHFGAEASQILDEVKEQRDYLDNIVNMDDNLTLLADFSGLSKSNIIGVQAVEDRIVAFSQNEAYQIIIDTVQEPSLIDTNAGIIAGSYFEDRDNVLFLTGENKLIEYSVSNSQFANTSDGVFKTAIDLETYSNKIYLLDAISSQIWRYTRGTSAYNGAGAYVTDSSVDLTDAISLAIDGNIWVLKKDGSIIKLLSGSNVDFNIKKAPMSSFDNPISIYTELAINQLYIADSGTNRIFVYDKSSNSNDITYSQQFSFESMKGKIQDFYLDKDRNVLVIATEQAVYELKF